MQNTMGMAKIIEINWFLILMLLIKAVIHFYNFPKYKMYVHYYYWFL